MKLLMLALCLSAGQPSGRFDVRDYGAVADDAGNDDAAINAAVAACKSAGGGVVYLPRGRYNLGAPVALADCQGVTLCGDGPATVLGSGSYCGPMVTVGLPGWGLPAAARPACPLAASAPKASVASLGRAAVGVTGHPLQFGWVSASGAPDYWGGGGVVTWDLAVSFPGPPAQWAPVVGFTESGAGSSWGNPQPWVIRWADGALALDVRCVGDGQFHRLRAPVDLSKALSRVTWQVDFANDRERVWVDGTPVATSWTPWSPSCVPPPLAMERHDGVQALQFFYSGPRMDGAAGTITPAAVHGFRVCRAPVWQWDAPSQTLAVNPALPASDDNRYFSGADQVIPPGSLIGLLPLDPEPSGSPTVAVSSYRGKGAMSWLTPNTRWTTSRVAVQDLRVAGALQPCVLAGRFSSLAVRRVACDGASQGFGTMPLMVSYPVTLDDCEFSGWDAPVVSFWQMISARNLVLPGTGRDGVRAFGGECLWDGVKVWRVPAHAETVFRLKGQDDGLGHTIRGLLVDNEEGNPVSRAFVEVEQGSVQRGRLVVEGANVSAVPPGSSLLRLVGRGASGNYAPYHVSARGLIAFGPVPVGLRVDGPQAFHGDVDLSMTYPGAVVGDPGKVVVTPPTPLYVPPQGLPPSTPAGR